jgi:hypothetical protein
MRYFRLSTALICMGFLLLMSCTKIYFKYPQPVDSKDLKHFPKELRGSWMFEGDIEGEIITVSKDYFQNFESRVETLVLAELDSTFSYKIVDETIYIIDEVGVHYGTVISADEEVISYRTEDHERYSLGNSCKLRKLGKNYVLNMQADNNQWWELYLITINANKDIIVRALDDEDLSFFAEEEILLGADGENKNRYVSTEWTRDVLEDQISKGLFGDTAFVLKEAHRVHFKKAHKIK